MALQLSLLEVVLPGGVQIYHMSTWGFPKIRGTLFGVPYNGDYSILGSILGSPILGNYHMSGMRFARFCGHRLWQDLFTWYFVVTVETVSGWWQYATGLGSRARYTVLGLPESRLKPY